MITRVRPAQLAAWFAANAAGTQPLVLDVREPWELQTASVRAEGFELRAIPMGEIPARLGELPKDQPIACLCHHGMRSMNVAAFLEQHGFEHLANISGASMPGRQKSTPQCPATDGLALGPAVFIPFVQTL